MLNVFKEKYKDSGIYCGHTKQFECYRPMNDINSVGTPDKENQIPCEISFAKDAPNPNLTGNMFATSLVLWMFIYLIQ